MQLVKFTGLFWLCIHLMACSLFSQPKELPLFPLFSPHDFPQAIQVTQLVTSQVNDLPQTLIAAWSVDKGEMKLVGLTATGQELLRLQYDGDKLTEHYSPLLNVALDGRIVLSQIQLAYWPLKNIQAELSDSAWQVVENRHQRQIEFNGHLITTITALNDDIEPIEFSQSWPELVINNPILNQEITIKTLNKGTLHE